jgi:hypothetical protein
MYKSMRDELLRRLKDPETKQCRDGLHDGERFCFLGLIIDVCPQAAWKEVVIGKVDENPCPFDVINLETERQFNCTGMPKFVIEACGIPRSMIIGRGDLLFALHMGTASYLNDVVGFTFPQFAELVEKYIPEVPDPMMDLSELLVEDYQLLELALVEED